MKHTFWLRYAILICFCAFLGCRFREDNLPDYRPSGGKLAEMEENLNLQNIIKDIRRLSLEIGPRPAGSIKANEAANWFKERLQEVNCNPRSHIFKLPNGRDGQNILCLLEGQTQRVIVIAAHLDTVEESPGANDDASGLAVLIELARLVKQYSLKPENTIMLAGFGAEEEVEGFNGHNYSSLSYLKSLTAGERDKIAGCIYLDKIGVGRKLLIRNVIFTNSQMVKLCLKAAEEIRRRSGDFPFKDGWLLSRPMSFEKHNIPTAYIEWDPDSQMHKAGDLPDNLSGEKILTAARIMLEILSSSKTGAFL